MNKEKLYLAADSGGSKTVWVLLNETGKAVASCRTLGVAAFGPDAEEFCSGHEKAETPLNWNSHWGKLYERKAKIFFVGTGMGRGSGSHFPSGY